jgi:hypothetical protein
MASRFAREVALPLFQLKKQLFSGLTSRKRSGHRGVKGIKTPDLPKLNCRQRL